MSTRPERYRRDLHAAVDVAVNPVIRDVDSARTRTGERTGGRDGKPEPMDPNSLTFGDWRETPRIDRQPDKRCRRTENYNTLSARAQIVCALLLISSIPAVMGSA